MATSRRGCERWERFENARYGSYDKKNLKHRQGDPRPFANRHLYTPPPCHDIKTAKEFKAKWECPHGYRWVPEGDWIVDNSQWSYCDDPIHGWCYAENFEELKRRWRDRETTSYKDVPLPDVEP